jgi:hypothetical protein
MLAAGVLAAAILSGAAGCGGSDGTAADLPDYPDAPEEFFGVVPQAEVGEDDLAQMGEGRVGTLRMVVPWSLMDSTPKPDDINFGYVDPIVFGAAAHGIRVLPTLYGTPDWVAEKLDGNECSPDCGRIAPRSDEAIDAFAEFAGALVDRYGPKGDLWEQVPEADQMPIHGWQLWNEQNSPTFYEPDVDPQDYGELVRVAAGVIHERDPDAEVILGGMFGTPMKGEPPAMAAPEFLRELYALDGVPEAFDAVAAHPYAAHQGKIELQVRLLHDEIERAGDDAGIWITEVGASSDEGDNPLELGPEGQAEHLRTAFEFFLDQREEFDIEGVTWYAWRDTSLPQCDWCAGSGLFEEEALEPKPAWDVFTAFTGGS